MNESISEFKSVKPLTLFVSFGRMGLITCENNVLKLLRCSGNIFHRLFQHSTQPQLDQLQTQITEFHKLEKVINITLVSLGLVMIYLTEVAYVIFLHLAYLLTSILGFNVIRTYYTLSVQLNLILIMNNIKKMLIETSTYLHALMEILILHFCDLINRIFGIIKAKLLFYLHAVHTFINLDYELLLVDLKSFQLLLEELNSLLDRYIKILQTAKVLLNTLKTLLFPIRILRTSIIIIDSFNKIITKLLCKFKTICSSSGKYSGIPCLLNQLSTGSGPGINFPNHMIFALIQITTNLSKVSIMNLDLSTITDFQNSVESIKKLLDMIDTADLVLSTEIMSIIEELLIVETINLGKLYIKINQIHNLYWKILIREYLLICTIEFYNDVTRNVSELFGSLKFDCCKVSKFLGKCSEVEEYITKVSTSITKCIKNLAKAYKTYEAFGVRPGLIELYLNIIIRILELKFYVDLIAMEILIFKTIILILVQMTVSSAILDELIKVIGKITDIDKAILTLSDCYWYLQTFYFIQLENTLVIFGLSELLLFSEFIHVYYHVLVMNIHWINWLIWGIECYIHHLIVFRHVTKSLNDIFGDIGKELQIVVSIIDVISEITKIIDKLNLIKSSITKLNDIQGSMDITNWKEKSKGIRQETQSINSDLSDINSEINEISGSVKSIYTSWAKLLGIYYYLLVLMDYVYIAILYTDNRFRVGIGIENRYFFGLIMSVVEPCNKQLMHILAYLIVMSAVMGNLIKIVQTSLGLIIVKTEWLKVLTTILKEDVDKIDKGVVAIECAIEGVVLNFIKCKIKSLSTHLIKIQDSNQNIDIININIKIYDLNNNLINNDKHYTCN